MKSIFLFSFLLGFTLSINGQSTYNYRLNFDLPLLTVFTSIEVTDSCFYVSGLTPDTLPPHFLGSLFTKLSLEGEIISYNILASPTKTYQTWTNTLEPTADGNFIVSGITIDSIGGRSALLIKYTSNGDTIFTKEFQSPYLENAFISTRASQYSSDNGIYIVSNITNTVNSNSDTYLIKTDSIGQFDWSTIYGENIASESVGAILVSNDKILIGGHIHNLNYVSDNFSSRAFLIQMSMEGEVEWEYESPEGELRNVVSDILRTNDGGYLLSCEKGVESGQSIGVVWQPYVFKLDANRNFVWGVNLRDTFHHSDNQINKIIEISDESGYVVAGRNYRPNWSENGYDYLGLIAKISPEGDSLWTRRYNHVQSAADNHIFYDLEETPDGGFVMVGQATDLNQGSGEQPLQRAWIVKVDENGCLVPGCHLLSSTEKLHKNPLQIKLYPNPANEYLNVYFRYPGLEKPTYFNLIDVSGKMVLSFESNHEDVTHIISVSDLPSGIYWLSCRVEDHVVVNEVIIGE